MLLRLRGPEGSHARGQEGASCWQATVGYSTSSAFGFAFHRELGETPRPPLPDRRPSPRRRERPRPPSKICSRGWGLTQRRDRPNVLDRRWHRLSVLAMVRPLSSGGQAAGTRRTEELRNG